MPLGALGDIVASFTEAHRKRFGFATPERPVTVEAVAVEVTASGDSIAEMPLPPRTNGGARADRPGADWSGGRAHRRAGVRPRRAARGRPHWRPGAGPRGDRDHRHRTRLDRRGDGARPHAAAPDAATRHAHRARHRARRSRAAGAVQQPVHDRRRADRGGAAEHVAQRQHQGAARLLLRDLRRGRRADRQRAARAGASRRDGRERAHGAAPPRRRR